MSNGKTTCFGYNEKTKTCKILKVSDCNGCKFYKRNDDPRNNALLEIHKLKSRGEKVE